jgi:hypothetical protein
LDPSRYTGLCTQFAERGALRAREVAAAIEARQTPQNELTGVMQGGPSHG